MTPRILAILLTAEEQEVKPILDILTERATKPVKQSAPIGDIWLGASTRGNILVLRTGIGLVQTAAVLSWALSKYSPQVVIDTGSAGALAPDLKIGDIVVGERHMYADADGTVYGTRFGQIPGQPEFFVGTSTMLGSAPATARKGLLISSDSWAYGSLAETFRSRFPEAIATDMESAAAAQVCTQWNVPFISVRCISDLCSAEAFDEHRVHLEHAGAIAARVGVEMLGAIEQPITGGPSQRFSQDSLTAALLLIFALVNDIEDGDPAALPDEITEAVKAHATDTTGHLLEPTLRKIAGARAAIDADPSLTLTANQYDSKRKGMVAELGLGTGRGHLSWPPTSQTIIKRFNGYWNDALSSVGLRVQTGRKRGGLRFSEKDYLGALRSFASWAAKNSITPSYKSYSQWLIQTGSKGKVPSGAAIRQRYGSWRRAAEAAQI